MEYPYTLKTGTLKEVVQKIPSIGVPSSFTVKHLKSLGYTSSNDQPIIKILKFIGLVDSSGAPTPVYKDYRGKNGAKILAHAIRSGYSELFETYPNADKKDDESLRHFFATKTEAGDRSLKAMVQTFKALCSLADFEGGPELMNTEGGVQTPSEPQGPTMRIGSKEGLSVNVNIELQIPETNNAEVYENFFKALKKHLLD